MDKNMEILGKGLAFLTNLGFEIQCNTNDLIKIADENDLETDDKLLKALLIDMLEKNEHVFDLVFKKIEGNVELTANINTIDVREVGFDLSIYSPYFNKTVIFDEEFDISNSLDFLNSLVFIKDLVDNYDFDKSKKGILLLASETYNDYDFVFEENTEQNRYDLEPVFLRLTTLDNKEIYHQLD